MQAKFIINTNFVIHEEKRSLFNGVMGGQYYTVCLYILG